MPSCCVGPVLAAQAAHPQPHTPPPRPNLQLMYYCLFWVVIAGIVAFRAWRGTLTDKHRAELDDAKSFAARRRREADGLAGAPGGGASLHAPCPGPVLPTHTAHAGQPTVRCEPPALLVDCPHTWAR